MIASTRLRASLRPVFVWLALVGAEAQAAPPLPEPVATPLTLVARPEFPGGKLAAMQGKAAGAGDYFTLEGLSVLQPVTVTLLAKEPATGLELALFKGGWEAPVRQASTGATGFVQALFRTHWDFRIQVKPSGAPAEYQLLVWVADEIVPEFSPVIVSKKAAPPAKEVK